jgi:hypothetical protein
VRRFIPGAIPGRGDTVPVVPDTGGPPPPARPSWRWGGVVGSLAALALVRAGVSTGLGAYVPAIRTPALLVGLLAGVALVELIVVGAAGGLSHAMRLTGAGPLGPGARVATGIALLAVPASAAVAARTGLSMAGVVAGTMRGGVVALVVAFGLGLAGAVVGSRPMRSQAEFAGPDGWRAIAWLAVGLAVLGGGTVAALAWRGKPHDPPTRPGVPVAVRPVLTPTPTWTLAADPGLIDSVRQDIERRVLITAGAPAEISSTCEEPSASFTCTVVYAGLPVPFLVRARQSGQFFSFEVDARTAVLTRYGVYARYSAEYLATGTDWRCDELPEAFVVELGRDLDRRCYVRLGRSGYTPVRITASRSGDLLFRLA